MRHVKANAPGEGLKEDTFYWGTPKGVGKVHARFVVDVYCSLAFAKVYTSKMPVTATELLYDRVLPLYETPGVPVKAVLTDNGREFCGKPERHPHELFLSLNDIEHRRTKVRSPRTNGFVERMNRALLDECLRVTGCAIWYTSLEEIQRNLDNFPEYCNVTRNHQGCPTTKTQARAGSARGARTEEASACRAGDRYTGERTGSIINDGRPRLPGHYST